MALFGGPFAHRPFGAPAWARAALAPFSQLPPRPFAALAPRRGAVRRRLPVVCVLHPVSWVVPLEPEESEARKKLASAVAAGAAGAQQLSSQLFTAAIRYAADAAEAAAQRAEARAAAEVAAAAAAAAAPPAPPATMALAAAPVMTADPAVPALSFLREDEQQWEQEQLQREQQCAETRAPAVAATAVAASATAPPAMAVPVPAAAGGAGVEEAPILELSKYVQSTLQELQADIVETRSAVASLEAQLLELQAKLAAALPADARRAAEAAAARVQQAEAERDSLWKGAEEVGLLEQRAADLRWELLAALQPAASREQYRAYHSLLTTLCLRRPLLVTLEARQAVLGLIQQIKEEPQVAVQQRAAPEASPAAAATAARGAEPQHGQRAQQGERGDQEIWRAAARAAAAVLHTQEQRAAPGAAAAAAVDEWWEQAERRWEGMVGPLEAAAAPPRAEQQLHQQQPRPQAPAQSAQPSKAAGGASALAATAVVELPSPVPIARPAAAPAAPARPAAAPTAVAAPAAAPARAPAKAPAKAAAPAVPLTLRLVAAGVSIPHPDKAATGGEDAFFVSGLGLGVAAVADGVGGWAAEGIDPSRYPRELLAACEDELKRQTEPLQVLLRAHQRAHAPGSCTVCLASMQQPAAKGGRSKGRSVLKLVSLGDCGMAVVRDGQGVVFQAEVQEHQFNQPFQMASPRFIEGGDHPRDAHQYEVAVQPGDVLIMGSDGLFDNLWPGDMEAMVHRRLRGMRGGGGPSALKAAARQLASELAERASAHARDPTYRSPFAVERHERLGNPVLRHIMPPQLGGKLDDITVVVGVVSE